MSSVGKRQREAEKARRKRQKAEARQQKRERGPREIPVCEPEEVTGDLEAAEEAAQARSSGPRGARAIPARLFVGSLSWGTSEDDLRAAFGKFGTVTDAVIVRDRDTGNSRGFGFVTMEDRKDAARAIDALHDAELDGRNIVVNMATDRQR